MAFAKLLCPCRAKPLAVIFTSSITLVTTFGLSQAFTAAAYADTPTLTTLVNFGGTNGYQPCAGFIADADGNLYSTTSSPGTVFKLATGTHQLTTLATGIYGSPFSTLLADTDSNLYGTTLMGGLYGQGSVYKMAAGTQKISTIVSFNGTNGVGPWSGLSVDSHGNFYGTTQQGGSKNQGTVYQLAAGTYSLTTLVSFNTANGSNPMGGITVDLNGNLFGTANIGGANNNGTIYKITADTHEFSLLASFKNTVTGAGPNGLIADTYGNLYGTTSGGGTYGRGTIFEFLADTQELITLASFKSTNGTQSMSPLIIDAAGNLFGTTSTGGANNNGTVFKLAAGSHEIINLVDFNGTNGKNPYTGGLYADANGILYGTTQGGGLNNQGTAFMLTNSGFVVAPEPATLAIFAPALLLFMKRRKL